MSIKKRLSMKKKANDTLNSVDSHISKRTIESAQLRTFTSTDSFGYQGARDFKDGEKPMIADGKFATLIISGPDIPSEDYVVMSIYYNEEDWCWKSYSTKEDAVKDAQILVGLLDNEIDEEQLKRFGFEIM